MVDLNLDELYAKQLSPIDVSNALNLQNLILPAGTAKLADTEYQIKVNSSPLLLDDLNNLPIKTVNGATVYMKDVAQVRDGFSVQNNIVRTNGSARRPDDGHPHRQSLHARHRQRRARRAARDSRHPPAGAEGHHAGRSVDLRARLHPGRGARSAHRRRPHRHDDPAVPGKLAQHADRLHLDSAFDPRLALHPEPAGANHQRDDARRPGARRRHPGGRRHRRNRKHAPQHRHAQAPGARGARWRRRRSPFPTFVSTLSICIVFVPVLLLTGTARYLFTPLAMAVVFAMLASYLLSRTLVPTMAHYLLQAEIGDRIARRRRRTRRRQGLLLAASTTCFNRALRSACASATSACSIGRSRHRGRVLTAFMAWSPSPRSGLVWLVGEDFFPTVDSGQMRAPCARPRRHAHRRNRARFAAHRARNPRRDPRR